MVSSPSKNISALPLKCTACRKPMDSPIVCRCCRAINPIEAGIDHFALLGLPRAYDVDLQELHLRFLNLTRDIHPDLFATSAEETRNLTMRISAQINEAYNVLKDPLLRAEYLLQQSGGKRSAEDKRVPGDLLMEVMELREAIEQAKSSGDESALDGHARAIARRKAGVEQSVADLARQVAKEPSDPLLDELRVQLNAMKYLRNLEEQLPQQAKR